MLTRFNDDFNRVVKLFDRVVGFDKYYPAFQSQTRDRSIYWYKNHDDHQTITISCPGMEDKDIKVTQGYDSEFEQAYISTSGEVTDEDVGTAFSCNYRFWIDEKKVDRITYVCDKGLLAIQLWYKTDSRVNIPIEKIKTGVGID